MLWAIRLTFLALVLLFILAAVTSCSRREEVRVLEPPPPVVEVPAVNDRLLGMQTRRSQLVGEIVRLTWVRNHGRLSIENQIAVDIAISDRRAELARLDAVVLVPAR